MDQSQVVNSTEMSETPERFETGEVKRRSFDDNEILRIKELVDQLYSSEGKIFSQNELADSGVDPRRELQLMGCDIARVDLLATNGAEITAEEYARTVIELGTPEKSGDIVEEEKSEVPDNEKLIVTKKLNDKEPLKIRASGAVVRIVPDENVESGVRAELLSLSGAKLSEVTLVKGRNVISDFDVAPITLDLREVTDERAVIEMYQTGAANSLKELNP